ncbi:MAG: hypothetical protein A2341_27660 [Deltaproteobacteria bacterium RIFOXYB12_FULL_58_9]|nr:MAG: hypothetical protein A2341_27660 [Deltaproteobacteria bacterium RIFOXYB12_FULL_58_9]
MSDARLVVLVLLAAVGCSTTEEPPRYYYAPAGDPIVYCKGDAGITGDAHINTGDTDVNPGDTHVNPGDTHVNPGDTSGPFVEHITQSNLERITGYLAADALQGRDNGSPGGLAARQFLINELILCDVPSAQTGTYEQPIVGGTGTNVLGRITGTNPSLAARHVIISAHYDHLGSCDGDICNGAYDNATAVAAVLSLACELSQNPPTRSVLVAFWDSEEPPDFLEQTMGSDYYATHPIVPLAQTDVAIVLDLMGGNLWSNNQEHVVLGSELSPQIHSLMAAANPPSGINIYHGGLHLVEKMMYLIFVVTNPWSDYDSFRDRGVPVLFMSDGQNRYYHTPEDEVGIVDFPKLLREAKYLRTITELVANSAVTPTFNGEGTDYLRDAITAQAILQAALASGGMVDSLNLSTATENVLISDLTDVSAAKTRFQNGTATSNDVWTLRSAVQRVMCHAGGTYDADTCNSL